jgi:hypothetical protein
VLRSHVGHTIEDWEVHRAAGKGVGCGAGIRGVAVAVGAEERGGNSLKTRVKETSLNLNMAHARN